MSATRDKSQKVAFIYSNLYELYKKGKEAAKAADTTVSPAQPPPIVDQNPEAEPRPFGARPGLTTSKIIKAGDAATAAAYMPPSFTAKRFESRRIATPEVIHQVRTQQQMANLNSLKCSLDQLQQLHQRLKFMLGELEELSLSDKPKK